MSEKMPSFQPQEQSQKQKSLFEKIDALLRDKDTAFAKILESLSPKKGDEYLNSTLKRILDLTVAVPAAVIATPAIALLGIAKKIEDGGTAFFIQERYDSIPLEGSDDTKLLTVWKIRSMVEGAEKDAPSVIREGLPEGTDPRVTQLGKTMRGYKLDELPQLYQAVIGQLSAVGVRPLPRESIKKFDTDPHEYKSRLLYREWAQAYGKGKKGLTGLHQVRDSGMRISKEIFHYDIFYTKNASLGLDLYLLWATLGRVLGYYPRRKRWIKSEHESV